MACRGHPPPPHVVPGTEPGPQLCTSVCAWMSVAVPFWPKKRPFFGEVSCGSNWCFLGKPVPFVLKGPPIHLLCILGPSYRAWLLVGAS